jgi:threonylcarbamoyladenosine tRNA methylthiotransferase MtaB
MKRRHTPDQAVAFCERVRALRPDVVFGADLIAGFPTESDAMFENTFAGIDEAGLTYLHVFPYSARAGTPGARMPQVPAPVRKARASRLRAAGDRALARFLLAQVGGVADVLVESEGRGHSAHYAPVRLAFAAPGGALVRARIAAAAKSYLFGTQAA